MRSVVWWSRAGKLLRAKLGARNNVARMSTLKKAFNSKFANMFNFRHMKGTVVGLFQIPQLTDYTGFYLLQENVANHIDHLCKEAVDPNRKRKLVEVFDDLSDTICRVADMADFVRVAHPDEEYRSAAEDTCIKLSELVETLNTNTSIHKALKDVIANGDKFPMDDVDKRVADLFMFDFEQSGIHLDAEKRDQFVRINDSITKLSNLFMKGVQSPSIVERDENDTGHKMFEMEKDMDNVYVYNLCSEHQNDLIRETAYKIFLRRNPHQEEILFDLLEGRRLLANIAGFPTYAHRVLKGTLGESPENVLKFLRILSGSIRDSAIDDYSIIHNMKMKSNQKAYVQLQDSTAGEDVMPWDPPYYTAMAKYSDIRDYHIHSFLSLGTCMEGLNNLFQKLFNVELQLAESGNGELWTKDVHKLKVVHGTEGLLGYIYCDFFEREDKPHQDCHFTIQGGRQCRNGTYQHPVVVLHLNLPCKRASAAYLTTAMVENLFHEFGHAMHSMLGRTRYQHVTGTRCPIDFAEVPAVLMEYFAADPRVIETYARHYITGNPLEEEAIQALSRSKKRFLASDLQTQVFYAALDQIYHAEALPDNSTTQILALIQNQYYGLPYIEDTAWQLRFSHLVGYGAKYYSYLMSRAVAAKIWRELFEADPFSRESGERYRREILAHGGEKHPQELIEGLLGEKMTFQSMVESLTHDLRSKGVRVKM